VKRIIAGPRASERNLSQGYPPPRRTQALKAALRTA
jgi:hypothetical protein